MWMRTPLSKQRNKHIQHVLIEAAKLAPRQSYELALVHEKNAERKPQPGHPRRSPKDGGLSACSESATTGFRI
jgi:hypothetical protein